MNKALKNVKNIAEYIQEEGILMQGTVIDLFASEAYIAMPDGLNICVSLVHLPSNIKVGSKINISANTMQMTNNNLINKIL